MMLAMIGGEIASPLTACNADETPEITSLFLKKAATGGVLFTGVCADLLLAQQGARWLGTEVERRLVMIDVVMINVVYEDRL